MLVQHVCTVSHVKSLAIAIIDVCVGGALQDIYSLTDFQLGYEHSEYTIGEEDGVVSNTVKIMKLNDNILQKDYQLTINVRHSDGPYTAALSKTLLLCYHTYTLT